MFKFIIPILLGASIALNAQNASHKQYRMDQAFQGTTVTLPSLSKATPRTDTSKELGFYEFAERRAVHLSPFNSGQWKRNTEEHIWTLEIESPGAAMINLGFTEYTLPDKAELRIHSIETGEQIGPFTISDNKVHSQLWTPNLAGDRLRLELKIPADQIQNFSLTLSAVHHGFSIAESRSSSGSCNVDVACGLADLIPIVDRYRDQIRSVANIQIDGTLLCTGFLINNSNNDFKPYFVTARHCGITADNAKSTVIYWNFENSTCRQIDSSSSGAKGDGTLNQFSIGSTVIASSIDGGADVSDVDFTLLLLDEPVDPDFRPYFVGWDIRAILPDSTFVVHHPNADEKRISFDFDKPEFDIVDDDSLFLKVLNWELGTTEGGSSGAPHFNNEGLAIGLLSGGEASCIIRDGSDEFVWLGITWNNGSTPETSLKNWLDPNNENLNVFEGLDGSFTITPNESFRKICGVKETSLQFEIEVDNNFKDNVQLELISLPEGLTANFENDIVAPGGTTTLTIDQLDLLGDDTYMIEFRGSDGQHVNTNNIELSVIPNVPEALTPSFPLNTDEAAESLAIFNWMGDSDSYDIEISDQIDFKSLIISSNDLSDTHFSTNLLISNNEYFWRVRGQNFCGKSAWSEPVQFRTTSLSCEIIEDNEVDLVISESRNDTIRAIIEVDITDPIVDLSIPVIEGLHTYNSDLVFSLISPMGTEVVLANTLCSGPIQFMDFSIGFSDLGLPHSEIPCSYTDARIYQPESSLDVLEGQNPQGNWVLQIIDLFANDSGVLNKFHLQICTGSDKVLFSQFSDQPIDGCGIDVANSSLTISSDFSGPVSISAIPSRDDISVELSKNTASPGETISFTINTINALNSEAASIKFVTSDNLVESTSIINISFDSQLEEISLNNPANNSIIRTGELLDFDWDDIADATAYTLQVSTDFLFEVIDVEISTNESAESIILDFISQGQAATVYWRVIAQGTNCAKISDSYSFLADFTDAVFNLQEASISIFPNPTSDHLFIKSNSPLSELSQISLFDISGKRLFSKEVPAGQLDIELSIQDIPQGLYYLSFKSHKDSFVTKIIKN